MKLVVFCPNWIGDVVMATPTLRALRKQFPDATITGLMRPYVAETLSGNPWLNDVILYDHKSKDRSQRTWSVLKTLRAERYDLGLLLTNSWRTAMLCWAGGVKRRVGYARDGRGWLLNDGIHCPRPKGGYKPSPVIDYYLKLAYHVGAPTEPYAMELFVGDQHRQAAEQIWQKFNLHGRQVVAFNTGGAFGPAKQWPNAHFAQLAQRAVDEQQAAVLVVCGPKETDLARDIVQSADRPGWVFSLADEKLSLGLSKAVVQRADVLVTTDSGPRHFATALGTPAVVLFGPTHIEWTRTYCSTETHLQKHLPCGPCQQRVCPLGHHRCMTELTVAEVWSATRQRLTACRPLRSVS